MDVLKQAEQLFWHGKFPEALDKLDQLETQKDVTELKQLQGQLLKCRVLAYLDIKKAQGLASQIIQASQDVDQPLIGVDALLMMAEAWLELGMLDTSMTFVDQGKAMLTTLSNVTVAERTQREAMVLALESGIYAYKGDPERAMKCVQQSLTLREQLQHTHEIAHSLYYLGIAYFARSELDTAAKYLQQSLMLYEQLGIPQAIAQSFFQLGRTYFVKFEHDRAIEYLQRGRAIFEKLELQHGIAYALTWIGAVYVSRGELNRAVEILQHSLAICEQLGISGTFAEARAYYYLGRSFTDMGELGPALDFHQKSLVLQEARGYKLYVGWNLNWIGDIYRAQGQLDIAFEYYVKSLKVHEEIGDAFSIGSAVLALMMISVELGDLEGARQYADRLEAIRGEVPSKVISQAGDFARAIMFKASPRIRDKMQAQMLFQQIVEEDVLWMYITFQAGVHLCELLFLEFKLSEDPKLLQEIKIVTDRLLNWATTKPSHYDLTETYLLQARLALLELDVPRTRRLLTQAQDIADSKGYQKLAMIISNEHDALLKQLTRWEALQTHEVSLTEVGELAGIEEQLTRMARQRIIEPPALQPEEPVLLLVLTESGLNIFSQKFTLGQQLDEHRIGGLLTALSNFGKDVFAGSETNRIMYEEYTVVLKAIDAFLFCYIFQGQSYGAFQKLEQFIARVRESTEIWEVLTTLTKTDTPLKTIEARRAQEESGLHQLITEIFLSANEEIQRGRENGAQI